MNNAGASDLRVFTLRSAGLAGMNYDNATASAPGFAGTWTQVSGAAGSWGANTIDSNFVRVTRPRNVAVLFCEYAGGAPLVAMPSGAAGAIQYADGSGGLDSDPNIVVSGGNVGIGTTTPEAKLVTVDTGTAAHRGIVASQYNDGIQGALFIGKKARGSLSSPTAIKNGDFLMALQSMGHTGTGFSVPMIAAGARASEDWSAAANGTDTVFYTIPNGATAQQERLRITNGGYVGLGTTSPLYKLHLLSTVDPGGILLDAIGIVASNVIGRRANGTTGALSGAMQNDNLLVLSGMGYGSSAYSSAPKASMHMKAAENWTDAAQGTYISFETTAAGTATRTERMRIDAAGNVGIGTTTPKGSAGPTLDIGAGSTVSALSLGADGSYIGLNTHFTGGWKYKGNGYASFLRQSTGGLDIYAAANNTGGTDAAMAPTLGMRIASSGYVGIGTTAPKTPLHVGTTNFSDSRYYAGSVVVENTLPSLTLVDTDGTTWLDHNNGNNRSWWIWDGSNWTQRMYLTTGGALWIAGSLSQNSDVRLKTDVQVIPNALGKLSAIQGVSYRWKDKGAEPGQHLGVIAQEVERVFPEVVHTHEDGTKSVAYTELIGPLIEAVKELKAANDNLREELKAANDNYMELRREVEALKVAQ
jgi:hypothetical protein